MKAYWLDDGKEISLEQLKAEGIDASTLDVSHFQPGLDKIKRENNFAAQDVVELTPETPDLPAILSKFDKEHLHTDEEARYVLAGSGIFDIRSTTDRWMRIEVYAADYISVPANRYHRFFVMEDNFIRCVRLFKENPVWTPFYKEEKQPALAQ